MKKNWAVFVICLSLIMVGVFSSAANAAIVPGGELSQKADDMGTDIYHLLVTPYPGYIYSGSVYLNKSPGSWHVLAFVNNGGLQISPDNNNFLVRTVGGNMQLTGYYTPTSYGTVFNITDLTSCYLGASYNYVTHNNVYRIAETKAQYNLFYIDDVWFDIENGAIRVNWSLPEADPSTIEYLVVNETNTGINSGWMRGSDCNNQWRDASATGSGITYKYHVEYRMPHPGNWSPNGYTGVAKTVAYTVTADTQPPSISSVTINSGAQYTNSRNVTLNITATDNVGVTHLRYSADNVNWSAWEAFNPNKLYTLPATDGNYTIYVQVKDAMSNLSNVVSASICLDTVKPTGSFKFSGNGQYFNNQITTLILNAQDSLSGVAEVQISNEPTFTGRPWDTFLGNKQWEVLPGEGEKTVYLRYRDQAGNISDTYPQTAILDMTPPTGTLKIKSKDGMPKTYSRAVDAFITGSDNLSGIDGVRLSNNNASWSSFPLTSPIEWELSPGGGTKTVYMQLTDRAGNVTFITDDIAYTEDISPPVANVSINNGAISTTEPEVTLQISCYDNATQFPNLRMQLSNDNINWSDWEPVSLEKNWDITNPAYGGTSEPGTKSVFLRVVDTDSNIGYAQASIGYNSSAPTLDEEGVEVVDAEIIEIDGKKTFVTRKNAVAIKLPFGNISTIRVALANYAWGEWIKYSETTEVLTGLGDGLTGVRVQAKDQYGVTSDIYTVRILVDHNAPVIHGLKTANGATAASGSVSLLIDVSDDLCSDLEYSYDNASWTKLSGDSISAPVHSGVNNIVIRVRDWAKNVSSRTVTVWGL